MGQPDPSQSTDLANRRAERHPARIGQKVLAAAGLVSGVFSVMTLVAAGILARTGNHTVYLGDRPVSDLSLFEMTGGAALGILGATASAAAATVGSLGVILAAIFSAAAGVVGGALAIVVAIGFVTGPLLLLGLIAYAVKRRFWPDVI